MSYLFRWIDLSFRFVPLKLHSTTLARKTATNPRLAKGTRKRPGPCPPAATLGKAVVFLLQLTGLRLRQAGKEVPTRVPCVLEVPGTSSGLRVSGVSVIGNCGHRRSESRLSDDETGGIRYAAEQLASSLLSRTCISPDDLLHLSLALPSEVPVRGVDISGSRSVSLGAFACSKLPGLLVRDTSKQHLSLCQRTLP